MIIPLGGGGSKVVASITVTYPAGSTCTCTLGSKVLTAKNTSGKWVFGLPSTGSWVVKAVKGSQSKSQTVSITTQGQVVNVTLAYETYYYNAGNQYTSVTGGWKKVNCGNGGGTLTLGTSSMVAVANWGQSVAGITTNKINLSNIKTLTFNATSTVGSNAHCVVATSQNFVFGDNTVVATVLLNTSAKTYTLNTSSLTGSYYIAFGVDHGNEIAKATVTVSSIYGKD